MCTRGPSISKSMLLPYILRGNVLTDIEPATPFEITQRYFGDASTAYIRNWFGLAAPGTEAERPKMEVL